METILYYFAFEHHGSHSAFNHLADYLSDKIRLDTTMRLPEWIPDRLKWRILPYWRRFSEWRLRPYYHSRRQYIVHYLYPENSLYAGWKWKGHHKLVLTCHQPASKLTQMKENEARHSGFFRGLEVADAVVVLSRTQISLYQQLAPQARVLFIPYAADTTFFTPSQQRKRVIHILTVGNWLRDYECWGEVVRQVLCLRRDVVFDVIANSNILKGLEHYSREFPGQVNLLTGLSDDELLNWYQTASILFLPLKDAIANTALLEGMACALPVVITDLPATREYGGDSAIYVTLGKTEQYIEHLVHLIDDSALRTKMSTASRQTALRYDWLLIADQYRSLYEDLQ